jgi:hypothetical protein
MSREQMVDKERYISQEKSNQVLYICSKEVWNRWTDVRDHEAYESIEKKDCILPFADLISIHRGHDIGIPVNGAARGRSG